MRDYWEINERLLRDYWDIIERLLRDYWENIERLLRDYWEIMNRVLLFIIINQNHKANKEKNEKVILTIQEKQSKQSNTKSNFKDLSIYSRSKIFAS